MPQERVLLLIVGLGAALAVTVSRLRENARGVENTRSGDGLSRNVSRAPPKTASGVTTTRTELCRRGIRGPDAHGLAQMCAGVDRRGQFGATARSRDGRMRRATYVVGMHRTRSGHFAQPRRCSPDGHAVVIIEPMSRQTLLRHLADLAAGLTLPPHAITGSRSSDDRS